MIRRSSDAAPSPPDARPTLLYAHGFASGPDSYKGRAFASHFEPLGYRVERLDLRLPDRDRLRPSAMVAEVRRRQKHTGASALVGSSLGGLVAAHAASGVEGLACLVLLAPAFGFAARWAERLGTDEFARWRAGAPLTVPDHAGGPPLAVDFGFHEDAVRLDAGPLDLRCPVLVLHGLRDEVVDIDGSRGFAARHPRVELVELDDGHELVASIPTLVTHTADLLARYLHPEPTT